MSAEQNIIPGTMMSLSKFIRGGRLFGKLNMAASNNSTNAAYLSALRSSFYRIIHLIDDCSRDAAALEYALFRVDVLYQAIQRFNVLLSEGARLHFLHRARKIFRAHFWRPRPFGARKISSMRCWRATRTFSINI